MTIPLVQFRNPPNPTATLHIAHANGFPPQTYEVLADALSKAFHVVGLAARPLWSPSPSPESFTSWEMMADDLLRGLDTYNLDRVIGIGHSMGGVATMIASLKAPERFDGIVLIDPVLMPRVYLRTLYLVRKLSSYQLPLTRMANKRRRIWESHEWAFNRYRDRPPFSHWHKEALWDYIRSVTRPVNDHLELIYSPEWEAQIYETMPLDVWKYVPKISVPAMVICGAESETFRKGSQRLWRRLRPDIDVIEVPDTTHFVPMEAPEVVANHIESFIHFLKDQS